jgi:hypothetical protein
MKWKLIDRNTGERIELGYTITTFRGDTYKLIGLRPPHKETSSGRVILDWCGGEVEYFPGAIGAKFIEEKGGPHLVYDRDAAEPSA